MTSVYRMMQQAGMPVSQEDLDASEAAADAETSSAPPPEPEMADEAPTDGLGGTILEVLSNPEMMQQLLSLTTMLARQGVPDGGAPAGSPASLEAPSFPPSATAAVKAEAGPAQHHKGHGRHHGGGHHGRHHKAAVSQLHQLRTPPVRHIAEGPRQRASPSPPLPRPRPAQRPQTTATELAAVQQRMGQGRGKLPVSKPVPFVAPPTGKWHGPSFTPGGGGSRLPYNRDAGGTRTDVSGRRVNVGRYRDSHNAEHDYEWTD